MKPATARTSLELLEQAEEVGSLADAGELDAEGLHLQEDVPHRHHMVLDERLEEHAQQAHQAVLHMLVLWAPTPHNDSRMLIVVDHCC